MDARLILASFVLQNVCVLLFIKVLLLHGCKFAWFCSDFELELSVEAI